MFTAPLMNNIKNSRFVLKRTHQEGSKSFDEKGSNPGEKTSSLEISIFNLGLPDSDLNRFRPNRSLFPLSKWVFFTTRETEWIQLYEINSESKSPQKTIRRLMHSFFRRELNSRGEEALIRLLLEFPNNFFLGAFALRDKLSRSTIRIRLNALLRLRGLIPLRNEEANSSNWSVVIKTWKEFRSLRPQKRYSGWKRHQNDQGSLTPNKEDPFLEQYSDPIILEDEISFVKEVISVGILPPISGDKSSLKSAIIRAETEKFLKYLKEETREQ